MAYPKFVSCTALRRPVKGLSSPEVKHPVVVPFRPLLGHLCSLNSRFQAPRLTTHTTGASFPQ